MRNIIPGSSVKRNRGNGLKSYFLMVLLGFLVSASMAQVTSSDKYIFISGQLTESQTGAPLSDHEIFIFSDSLANNGFGYYAVTRTDVNGFYWDTVKTNQSDGLLNLSTNDFEGNLVAFDRYYRFVWETEYQMFVDFAIFDPNSNTEFQANFRSEQDTVNQNPLKVVFRDVSIGPSIKGWEWQFGDGITSMVQDPEHLYAEPGNYLVTLTVSAYPISTEIPVTSTITKQVQVGLTNFYNVGGHVFAEYFPIDFGLAYLYAFDPDNNLVPLDTTTINTEYGYYYFYEVPEGKYIVKARLEGNSVHYGSFVPTYYGNTINWQQAEEVIPTEDNFELDIALIPSLGITTGLGRITGQISYDTLRDGSSAIPAGDVEIVLLNDRGNYLTCGLSDIEGFFNFAELDLGTYQLFPDVTGVPTNPMFVTLSEEEPAAEDLSLVIHTEEIIFSIRDKESAFLGKALVAYPNPVYDVATIQLEMKRSSTVDIQLLDLTGRTLIRQYSAMNAGPNRISLDMSGLSGGCYQVMIIPEDKIAVTTRLIKLN
jgi:PKD repeat protein